MKAIVPVEVKFTKHIVVILLVILLLVGTVLSQIKLVHASVPVNIFPALGIENFSVYDSKETYTLPNTPIFTSTMIYLSVASNLNGVPNFLDVDCLNEYQSNYFEFTGAFRGSFVNGSAVNATDTNDNEIAVFFTDTLSFNGHEFGFVDYLNTNLILGYVQDGSTVNYQPLGYTDDSGYHSYSGDGVTHVFKAIALPYNLFYFYIDNRLCGAIVYTASPPTDYQSLYYYPVMTTHRVTLNWYSGETSVTGLYLRVNRFIIGTSLVPPSTPPNPLIFYGVDIIIAFFTISFVSVLPATMTGLLARVVDHGKAGAIIGFMIGLFICAFYNLMPVTWFVFAMVIFSGLFYIYWRHT